MAVAQPNNQEIFEKIVEMIFSDGVTMETRFHIEDFPKLEKIQFSDSVTEFENMMVQFCDKLMTVNIPASVTKIEKSAFYQCPNLTNILLDEESEYFVMEEGILYDADMKMVYLYPPMKAETDYVMPETVDSILPGAFWGNEFLESISFSDEVDLLFETWFDGCSSLKHVDLPLKLSRLGGNPFYECESLAELTIPNSNYRFYVEDNVLYGFDNAIYIYPRAKEGTDFIVPDGIETIEKHAFYKAESLQNVTLPESMSTIGKEAFAECTALENIFIYNDFVKFEDDCFLYSPNITLHGHEGSAAQIYAQQNHLPFEVME